MALKIQRIALPEVCSLLSWQKNDLWWQGPQWLEYKGTAWDEVIEVDEHPIPSEEREIQQSVLSFLVSGIPLLDQVSQYDLSLIHI